ncbi:MAG: cytochrome c [Acidobacteria bacterium]|nr:cytochrome c [Acidobacteriota bacterium]
MNERTIKTRTLIFACCLLPLAFLASACREDMQNQPKYKPYRPGAFFKDGQSGRQLIDGTVARGHLNDDPLFYTGKIPETGNQSQSQGAMPSEFKGFTATFPIEVTAATLTRGQERFNIYCAVCHDRTGTGNGMVVQRGYKKPPSFHSDRLRQAPVGYFFDVITNGFGAMPDYAAQIQARDRWAIVAYLRALQLSENTNVNTLSPDERKKLDSGAGTTESKTEKGEQHQ